MSTADARDMYSAMSGHEFEWIRTTAGYALGYLALKTHDTEVVPSVRSHQYFWLLKDRSRVPEWVPMLLESLLGRPRLEALRNQYHLSPEAQIYRAERQKELELRMHRIKGRNPLTPIPDLVHLGTGSPQAVVGAPADNTTTMDPKPRRKAAPKRKKKPASTSPADSQPTPTTSTTP